MPRRIIVTLSSNNLISCHLTKFSTAHFLLQICHNDLSTYVGCHIISKYLEKAKKLLKTKTILVGFGYFI